MEDRAITSNTSDSTAVDFGRLANDLPFMLRTVQARLRPEGQALIDMLGVEPGVIGVLSVIDLNPGISQNDLAAAVAQKKSAVTKIVNALEDRGLVARRRLAQDRRMNALTLTREGEALTRRVHAEADALHARLFEGIPTRDRDVFFDVLGTLSRRLAHDRVDGDDAA